MSAAGRSLEAAVARAAAHYTRVDRGELQKQHTPRSFAGGFVGDAPIDFRGWFADDIGARQPCAIECKETTHGRLAFEDEHGGLSAAQLDAIRDAVARRVQSWVLVQCTPEREVYRIDGRDVVAFADAPWRASLSLPWMRANGELCKVSDFGHPTRAAVWWLDTRLHHERTMAALAVAAERAGAPVIELYARSTTPSKSTTTFRELMAAKPKRDASDAEHLEWCKRFSEWDLNNNIRLAKRELAKRRGRGRWQGGGHR